MSTLSGFGRYSGGSNNSKKTGLADIFSEERKPYQRRAMGEVTPNETLDMGAFDEIDDIPENSEMAIIEEHLLDLTEGDIDADMGITGPDYETRQRNKFRFDTEAPEEVYAPAEKAKDIVEDESDADWEDALDTIEEIL